MENLLHKCILDNSRVFGPPPSKGPSASSTRNPTSWDLSHRELYEEMLVSPLCTIRNYAQKRLKDIDHEERMQLLHRTLDSSDRSLKATTNSEESEEPEVVKDPTLSWWLNEVADEDGQSNGNENSEEGKGYQAKVAEKNYKASPMVPGEGKDPDHSHSTSTEDAACAKTAGNWFATAQNDSDETPAVTKDAVAIEKPAPLQKSAKTTYSLATEDTACAETAGNWFAGGQKDSDKTPAVAKSAVAIQRPAPLQKLAKTPRCTSNDDATCAATAGTWFWETGEKETPIVSKNATIDKPDTLQKQVKTGETDQNKGKSNGNGQKNQDGKEKKGNEGMSDVKRKESWLEWFTT